MDLIWLCLRNEKTLKEKTRRNTTFNQEKIQVSKVTKNLRFKVLIFVLVASCGNINDVSAVIFDAKVTFSACE